MPGQDLTRVTIPSFFLEPRSLLERLVCFCARAARVGGRRLHLLCDDRVSSASFPAPCRVWCLLAPPPSSFPRLLASQADTLMHPDVLLRSAQAAEPLERMKLVVAWFLSGFHYKTVVRGAAGRAPSRNPGRAPLVPSPLLFLPRPSRPCSSSFAQGVKKPFNPVIGETFACMWKHDDGSRSQYFSEQVAHRPPVSAIYFENRRHGITASAHVWTKSQFSAPQTVKSILDGVCLLHFAALDEVRAAAACARRC